MAHMFAKIFSFQEECLVLSKGYCLILFFQNERFVFLFLYHFAGFPAACLKCLCDPAMPEDPDDNHDNMAGKVESVPTLTDSENHSGTSSENGTEATVWIT